MYVRVYVTVSCNEYKEARLSMCVRTRVCAVVGLLRTCSVAMLLWQRHVICSRPSAEALGIAFFNVHRTCTHCSQRTCSVMVSCKLSTAQQLWLGVVALWASDLYVRTYVCATNLWIVLVLHLLTGSELSNAYTHTQWTVECDSVLLSVCYNWELVLHLMLLCSASHKVMCCVCHNEQLCVWSLRMQSVVWLPCVW